MKAQWNYSLGALGACLFMMACGDTSMESVADTGESGPVTYSPESGLTLRDETWDALGLRSVAVVPSIFATEWSIRVRGIGMGSDGGVLVRGVAPGVPNQNSDATYAVTWDGSQDAVEATLVERSPSLASVLGGAEMLWEVENPGAWDSAMELEGRLLATLADEREAPALPSTAVVRAALGDFVYLTLGPGRATRRRVVTGIQRSGLTEILDGVSAGDRVVTDGAEALWILELAMVGGMGQLPELQKEVRE